MEKSNVSFTPISLTIPNSMTNDGEDKIEDEEDVARVMHKYKKCFFDAGILNGHTLSYRIIFGVTIAYAIGAIVPNLLSLAL